MEESSTEEIERIDLETETETLIEQYVFFIPNRGK